MLYIGNFSYNDDTDSKDNYCLMPIVVEAENADEAMEKFAAHLHEVRKTSDLLDGAHEIYLDSLTELEGVPNAYAWGDEDDEREHAHHDDLDDLDEEDLMDQEPFLLFE